MLHLWDSLRLLDGPVNPEQREHYWARLGETMAQQEVMMAQQETAMAQQEATMAQQEATMARQEPTPQNSRLRSHRFRLQQPASPISNRGR